RHGADVLEHGVHVLAGRAVDRDEQVAEHEQRSESQQHGPVPAARELLLALRSGVTDSSPAAAASWATAARTAPTSARPASASPPACVPDVTSCSLSRSASPQIGRASCRE